MAIYEYRCERDGAFDVSLPMGTAPTSVGCPRCAREGERVFSSPMVSFAPRALVAALDREEKTKTDPDIVTSIPPKPRHQRTPTVPLTPNLARLPRPKY
jgi:putative FmdB family regulatory protein